MFDLETAIADWKQSLAARESLSTDDIAELETHVRESVSALGSGSLNEEEAFLIAQRRVGPIAELDSEYAKQDPKTVWVRRLKWMLLGELLFTVYHSFVSSLYNAVIVRLLPSDGSSVVYALSFSTGSMLLGAVVLLLGSLLTIRHAAWIERVSVGFLRIPLPALLSLPVALFALPRLIAITHHLLFDFSGNDMHSVNALFLGLSLMAPLPLVVAIYFLHRHERKSEIA